MIRIETYAVIVAPFRLKEKASLMIYSWFPKASLQITIFTVIGISFSFLLSIGSQSVVGAPSGEATFKANCAQCHTGGANIINPKKPLKGSDKLASKEAFKAYISKANGAMPAFLQIANDAPTMEALLTYCKTFK